MASPVIAANQLSRAFGKIVAVDELSLEIHAGEVFGFLGHNGAGKTTTVRLLNGILTPTGGSMQILGFDPVTQGTQVRARSGVLTENPALDDRLSARDTLRIYGDIYGVPKDRIGARADELLEMFDLTARARDKVGGFSKGMRQRLALARTIIHNPQIIYLDEPTAALDPVATRDVHTLIRNASQLEGRTVFMCTHNLNEAERLCTRVAVLAQGRLLAVGTPAELASRYGTQQRLLIEVAPSQVQDARAILERLPFAPVVTQDDATSPTLQVQGVPYTEAPHVVAALAHAGIGVYQVIREQATLEDVYFALQEDIHNDLESDDNLPAAFNGDMHAARAVAAQEEAR